MEMKMELNKGAVYLPRDFTRFPDYKSYYCGWDDVYSAKQKMEQCLAQMGVQTDLAAHSADSTIVVGGKTYTHATGVGEFLDAVSEDVRQIGLVVIVYASDEYDFAVVPSSLIDESDEYRAYLAIREHEGSAPDEYSDADLV